MQNLLCSSLSRSSLGLSLLHQAIAIVPRPIPRRPGNLNSMPRVRRIQGVFGRTIEAGPLYRRLHQSSLHLSEAAMRCWILLSSNLELCIMLPNYFLHTVEQISSTPIRLLVTGVSRLLKAHDALHWASCENVSLKPDFDTFQTHFVFRKFILFTLVTTITKS